METEVYASEGEKKEFYLVPAGTYQAVAYDVWDIGFQKSQFQGKESYKHKVIIAFELNNKIPFGKYAGKRATVTQRYTLSLNSKASLRRMLENWRGRAFTAAELKQFPLSSIIGANAMVSIVHNEVGDRVYANLGSVSKVMEGLPIMTPENPRSTPEWIVKQRAKAVDPEVVEGSRVYSEDDDSEVPF